MAKPLDDDIVVTGIGAFTPLGNTVADHYASLLAGKSAIKRIQPDQGVDGYYWYAASIEGFDPKAHVQPRKVIKVMCREIQMAFGSAMQACKQAQVQPGALNPDRIGTVFSGEIILSDLAEVEDIVRRCTVDGEMLHSQWAPQAMDHMYPLWMLKSLPNMAACHVGIALDARGPNNTITTEGTSSLAALLEAINVIKRDKADVMVIGSTSSRQGASRLLQRHAEDYASKDFSGSECCRPFDRSRSGTATGETSCAMVIERRSHAVARNVQPLATIEAWSNCFSPSRLGRWSGVQDATARTLKYLLERANCSLDAVDHINAAANGTVPGDSFEAKGIAAVTQKLPVVSYKGAFGDSLSGAGLEEWISSWIGMRDGIIAPTINHEVTADDCPIHVLHGDSKKRTQDRFVKLSNSPSGRCVGIMTRMES